DADNTTARIMFRTHIRLPPDAVAGISIFPDDSGDPFGVTLTFIRCRHRNTSQLDRISSFSLVLRKSDATIGKPPGLGVQGEAVRSSCRAIRSPPQPGASCSARLDILLPDLGEGGPTSTNRSQSLFAERATKRQTFTSAPVLNSISAIFAL